MHTKQQTRNKKNIKSIYNIYLNSILDENETDEIKQNKILMLNIQFMQSENPNDYDKKAIKNVVYHLDLHRYSNPQLEGIPETLIKIYYNYKQQEQEQEQDATLNKNVFNVVY